jgi:hypothetical protein
MIGEFLSILLYLFVGIVSLTMAYRNLFSERLLAFHEKASGVEWHQLSAGLQEVVIALMRVSGLGFLIVGVMLIVFPLANYFLHSAFLRYAVPMIAMIYCCGLFLYNYRLHVRTSAETPWKKSLYAVLALIAGLLFSLL